MSVSAADRRPIIETATVDGIIHPVSSDFMRSAIAKADAEGAALIVFTLKTPGGLLDATRDINNAIIAAKTPVAVFVGPAGSRAASAGFLITIAADVAAMAPGTHIGAAHPVTGNGEKIDEVMGKKMASDTAAYARTLATQRGRNVPLVEQAVTESRSFTEQEALTAPPPLIDLVASNVTDLIQKLDGRTIKRFNGSSTTLALKDADIRYIEMTLGQKILSAIAHPQIAYLLLTLGTLGLTIELWSPGAVRARGRRRHLPAAGVLRAPGPARELRRRPADPAGIPAAGPGGQDHQPRAAGRGRDRESPVRLPDADRLAAAGNADRAAPDPSGGGHAVGASSCSWWRLGLKAQNQPSVTGESGMLHAPGQALTAIDPGGVGRVSTHGEIWSATALEAIRPGDPVEVVGVNGLTLTVKRPA